MVSATLLETKEPIDTQMKLVVTNGSEISANVSVGLVTAVWVAAGDEITTGERLFDVDGVGRYGAHSPEPFYRNLEAGAVGADVVMLKNLLIGFGLLAEDANQSARFDNSTARAVRELNRIWSVPNASMSFDPNLVVWLPTPQVAVAEVALSQGKPVPPAGEAIFKGGAQVLLSQLSLVNNENFVDGFVGGEVTDRTTGTLLGTLASPDGTVELDPQGFNQWLAANDTAVPGASAESGVQIQVTRPNISPGKLQWIHQSVNVLGRRSAIDNVAVSLYAQGSTRAEALVVAEAALERVGLAGFATRRVTTLSGGEMQRVSIARALACRPTLVLADEPTGQLDRSTTQTVADALVALRESGAVVIIATHDPIVAAICDRRIEIVDGQINEAA